MRPFLLPLCGAALLASSACGKKADLKTQVFELEKAFPTAPAGTPVQAERAASNQAPLTDANACVRLALAAVRTNDFAGGVITLQAVQRMPGLTPEQLMSLQTAMQAMTADLLVRASKGDAKAKADLAAIERTRSQ